MWIFTPIGFFSVVKKEHDAADEITILNPWWGRKLRLPKQNPPEQTFLEYHRENIFKSI